MSENSSQSNPSDVENRIRPWMLPGIDIAENVQGSLVSLDPLVYCLGLGGHTPMGMLAFDAFLDTPVPHFFFLNTFWSFASDDLRDLVFGRLNRVVEDFPQHSYALLISDAADWFMRELIDPRIPIYICGEHSLVDVSKFICRPAPITFDAVYTAQDAPYKRIELARDIDRVCLISKNYKPRPDWTSIHCPNLALGWMSPHQISEYLNRSAVGLMLSSREGQNRATIEYLLCGLPVVSTPNRGGRDRYLTPANSVISADDAPSVADAVAFIARAGLDRHTISADAATSVLQERAWLSQIIDDVLASRGARAVNAKMVSLPHHGFTASNSISHVLRHRYPRLSQG